MTIETLTNILLIIVAIGWFGFRQLTWQPIAADRLWKLPAILAVVGIISLSRSTTNVTTLDISLLLLEIVMSLTVGAVMGLIATIRPRKQLDDSQRDTVPGSGASGRLVTHESRTGWLGVALWVVFIAVRVGLGVFGASTGSTIAASTGVILILIAANRAARAGVLCARLDRTATPVRSN